MRRLVLGLVCLLAMAGLCLGTAGHGTPATVQVPAEPGAQGLHSENIWRKGERQDRADDTADDPTAPEGTAAASPRRRGRAGRRVRSRIPPTGRALDHLHLPRAPPGHPPSQK